MDSPEQEGQDTRLHATPAPEEKVSELRRQLFEMTCSVKGKGGGGKGVKTSSADSLLEDSFLLPLFSTDFLARCLVARDLNVEKALKLAAFTMKWRQDRNMDKLDVANRLNEEGRTGKIQLAGVDVNGRPVIIFDDHVQNTKDVPYQMAFMAFMFDLAAKALQLNGRHLKQVDKSVLPKQQQGENGAASDGAGNNDNDNDNDNDNGNDTEEEKKASTPDDSPPPPPSSSPSATSQSSSQSPPPLQSPPVAKWVLAMRLTKFSPFNSPSIAVSRETVQVMTRAYAERLGVLIVWDAPAYFYTVYRLVSMFIDKRTKDKIIVVPKGKGGVGGQFDLKLRTILGENYRSLLHFDQEYEANVKRSPGYVHEESWNTAMAIERSWAKEIEPSILERAASEIRRDCFGKK